MELYQLTERIWYSQFEERRDRPALGYVKGDNWSLAIDAGHSEDHLKEFYQQLVKNDLPLPAVTVITHWHWDHSFAMHCINGLSIASKKTNGHLREFIRQRTAENDQKFLNLDPSISMEYAGGREIKVVEADIVYEGSLNLNAGNEEIVVFEAPSPHTDDATLIYLPEEKVLFFGDAMSGVFPTWVADSKMTARFIETLEHTDADICIGGHWPKWNKRELIKFLKESM